MKNAQNYRSLSPVELYRMADKLDARGLLRQAEARRRLAHAKQREAEGRVFGGHVEDDPSQPKNCET